jgi:CRP/FNR family transcriptional regulator
MVIALQDDDRLDTNDKRSRPLLGGDHLFREGERFRSLYVVKSGSVKSSTRDADGDTQVLGFHLPGEITGLDGIEKNAHTCSAQVLETSLICEIPYGRLKELSATIPSLQHQMYRLLSREIAYENELLLLLATRNADERLAAFLVNMSGRLRQRGLCATDFCLSMSRHDIANYLGLSAETVSRGFTRFQNESLLKVDRKHVQLLNVTALEVLGAATPAPTIHRF